MDKQNVTLAIPKNILQQAKLIAVRQQTSISGLLTRMLEELVESEEEYGKAREQHLALLEHGFDLGTEGRVSWTRDELHER